MMPGTAYSLKQCREELVAVGIKLYLVVLEGQCKALVGEQLYKRAVPIGYPQLALLYKLEHLPLRQLVERALRHKAHLACVLPEEDVQHDAKNRHKHKHQHPCHGFGRLPVVHKHSDNDAHYHYGVDHYEYPMNVNHTKPYLCLSTDGL